MAVAQIELPTPAAPLELQKEYARPASKNSWRNRIGHAYLALNMALAAPLTDRTPSQIDSPDPGTTTRQEALYGQPEPPYNLMAYYGLTPENVPGEHQIISFDISDWNISTSAVNQGAVEGYTEQDNQLIFHQIEQMTYANQDGATISWDHKDDPRDKLLRHIVSLMHRPDNPNPGFKWAVLYEKEGYEQADGQKDPSEADINIDLDNLVDVLNDPSYLRDQNGRQMLFVYSDWKDTVGYFQKWYKIAKDRNLHIVLKEIFAQGIFEMIPGIGEEIREAREAGYVSFFPYEPSLYEAETAETYAVAPRFSKKGAWNELPDNPDRYKRSVYNMVKSDKLIQYIISFNEFAERTGQTPQNLETDHNLIPPNPRIADKKHNSTELHVFP